MKSLKIFLFLLIILPGSISAKDIKFETLTTTGGVTYKSVTVRTVTAANIRIFHSTGATVIPYEELPVDVQQKLGGFDPEKAEEFRKDARKKQARMNKHLAEQEKRAAQIAKDRKKKKEVEEARGPKKWIIGKVLKVQENGVLLLPPSEKNRSAIPNTNIEPTPGALRRLAREKNQLPRDLRVYLANGGTFFGSVSGKKYMAKNWIKTSGDYAKIFPLETIFNQFQVMDSLSPFEMISQDKPIVVKTNGAMKVADSKS